VLWCDADGNLFPSEEPAFEASVVVMQAMLASLGVDVALDPEQLRRETTGLNFRTTALRLMSESGVSLPAPTLEEWVRKEREEVTHHLSVVLSPDADVVAPLARLSQSMALVAVSSSALARLDACFTATGLSELIPADRRFSAEDSLPTPTSKPDPAIYVHACRALGVAAADTCAVEDSVPGVQAAVDAGIPTVGNVQFVPASERRTRVGELEAAGAFRVVASWEELEGLLSAPEMTMRASTGR
jgi:beta-phosphoglucomutase-like phosphatase (HAD superfamily)